MLFRSLGAWQQWIADAPDELWSLCGITAGKPSASRVIGCYLGPASSLNPLLDRLPRTTSRTVATKGYLDAMRYFAGCSQDTIAQCAESGRQGFVATGHMLPTAVDPARFVSTVDGRSGVDILIDSWGGAISRIAPDATAVPHRTALASAQIYATATPTTRTRVSATVTEIRTALSALTGPAGYVNYIDPTLPNWPTAYYGPNLPRLKKTATTYDPDTTFTFAQNIAKA